MEVGTWKGATLISACHGASLDKATVIDNWSTFGGPREQFYDNVKEFETGLPTLNIIDEDCWKVDPTSIKPKVDIFFYDGHHSEDGQKKAITHFWDALSKPAIIVVDDWDDPNYDVPKGTREGLAEVGADIVLEFERHADHQADADGWWNGVFVCVAKKGVSSREEDKFE